MAMHHFNDRNASIVPEIDNINPTCSFSFTEPTIVDSKTDQGAAVRGFYDAAELFEQRPCAVIGTVEDQVNTHLIPTINSYMIPLLSYYTDDAMFVMSEGTIGMTLSAMGRANAMVAYLKSREYLAFWYSAESARESALADALVSYGGNEFSVTVFRIKIQDNIKTKLQQLKESGIKTIFLSVLEPVDLLLYSMLLDELEMLESSFVYIFPPELVPTDIVGDLYGEHEPGTPLYKLLSGSLVFDRLDGFRVDPDNDKFIDLWMQQSSDTVSEINSIVPEGSLYLAAPDYFQVVNPSNFACIVCI
jgi:hypothetical protein